MREVLAWGLVIFLVLVVAGRSDILHDIGSAVRQGVDSIQNGYNGDQPNNKE